MHPVVELGQPLPRSGPISPPRFHNAGFFLFGRGTNGNARTLKSLSGRINPERPCPDRLHPNPTSAGVGFLRQSRPRTLIS